MQRSPPRVVILGGGYAGLAAAIRLTQARPAAQVWLVDREPAFTDVTQLHRTVEAPLASLQVPFAKLQARHGFAFVRGAVRFTPAALARWQRTRVLRAGGEQLAFDCLVIATGAAPRSRASPGVATLRELRGTGAKGQVDRLVKQSRDGAPLLTIAGGGPTGMQFLFELDDYLRRMRIRRTLHLVHDGERFLPAFPRAFHDTIADKLAARADTIRCHPHRRLVAQYSDLATLESRRNGARRTVRSPATWLFTGAAPAPFELHCNQFGQVLVDGAPLANVFAAGDCARFAGTGLDTLTAQAAVRKGRLVADNILRLARGRAPVAYDYRELGYFLSLGPLDGVGWVLSPAAVVSGTPAFAAKQAIEAQFRLLLNGVDTYLG